VEEDDDGGPFQPFSVNFPAPAGQVAQIVLLDGETVLATQTVGTNAPVVSIVEPGGGESVDDELTLVWTATDADAGDRLSFSVQYSPDNGQTWRAVVTEIPNTSGTDTMTVKLRDVRALPASTTGGLIRVLASDGYHTTLAASEPFTVVPRAPEPRILAPAPSASVPAGQAIILQGGVSDAEEGSLTGDALNWTVDGDMTAPITGSGEELIVPGLAPGSYDVTLVATDMTANTASTMGAFTVAPLSIPITGAPTLDGSCDDDPYVTATRLQLQPYAYGSQATVLLARTDGHLWACFSNLKRGGGSTPSAVLRADPNNSHDATPQPDDYEFRLTDEGSTTSLKGDGDVFVAGGPGGVDGRVSADATHWNAEMQIDAAVLGGWEHAIGIQVGHRSVTTPGDDAHWPYLSAATNPSTWAATALGVLPQITSVEPLSATLNGPEFTLTISGTNFVDESVVQWGGAAKPTTFVSATQLQATIATADLGTAGTLPVRVVNPGLEATPSNVVMFTVNNPTPTITRAALNGNALAIEGSGFVAGAKVLWNGIEQLTVVSNDGRAVATIDATLIPAAGTVILTVMNPAPALSPSNEWRLTSGGTGPGGNLLFLPLIRRGDPSTLNN
jgi:hypothetical protein